MRIRFIHWLNHRVFKTPEGQVAHKFVRIVYRVLFLMRYFYEKQSGIKYDMMRDVYIINGMKYSRDALEYFSHTAKEGDVFMFVKRDDGCATIKQISMPLKPQLN